MDWAIVPWSASVHSVYLCWFAYITVADALFGPVPCPGLTPTSAAVLECTASCQAATCSALASFFASTYNATTPYLKSWRNKGGWKTVLTKNCTQILTIPTADGTPGYCSWPGVTCCSRPAQMMGLCPMINVLMELKLEVNGLNGSISDPAFEQSIAQLHACGLISLELAGNALSGTFSNYWGEFRNLWALNVAKNMIHGTIPEAFRQWKQLQLLQLDNNLMHGTIPHWLSELGALVWLGLSAFAGVNPDGSRGLTGTIPASLGQLNQLQLLSLDSNSLTGAMPAQLCDSPLLVLILRSNRIKGSVGDLFNCTKLGFLDIHDNKFSGTLPDVSSWGLDELSWIDLSNNNLSGTLPMALYRMGFVSHVKLANNRLSGPIHREITNMLYLLSIDLHGNQLTGTIDESVWYMPRLVHIDLSNNLLRGSISPAIGSGYYLSDVLLNDNQLTGQIPSDIALVPSLATMDLRNNPLSCSGAGLNSSTSGHCSDHQIVLPCFLKLSAYTVPRADASYMECPVIERKPRALAVQDCQSIKQALWGKPLTDLPTDNARVQNWYLDPGYYQYHGCKCLGGYHEVWSAHNTVLECRPIAGVPAMAEPIAAAVAVSGFLLTVAVGLLVWLKLTVQLRRKWLRDKELHKHRLKGVPNGGPAAVVVTDVEKYSDLMQLNAAVTTRAMGIHNAILRKAVTTHAGHVIEQEGDSWSVAFHRPVDAVAFCLQVQQALQRTQWPDELVGIMATKSEPAKPLISGSAPSYTNQVTAEVIINPKSHRSIESDGTTMLTAQPMKPTDQATVLVRHSTSDGSSLAGRVSSMLQHLLGRGGRKIMPDESSECSHSEGGNTSTQCGSRVPVPSHRRSVDSVFSHDRATSVTSVSKATNSTSARLKGKHLKMASGDVLGLRVRMGIASGWVPASSDIKVSAVFVLAKAVSDMANGGQILMESRTADAVRDWLSDLGCVDHKGYNDKLLSTSHNQASRLNTNGFMRRVISLMSYMLRVTINERDPILLDMGQFWMPSLLSTIQAVKAAVKAGEALSNAQRSGLQRRTGASASVDNLKTEGGHGAVQMAAGPLSSHLCQKASSAVVASALGRGACCMTASDALYIHSIVAHPLHARSKLWRNDLNLKDNNQQIVKGYFAAPGTQMANLSLAKAAFLEIQRPLLPPVTMVFAAVDEARLLRKKDSVMRTVFDALSKILQATLLSFSDGYLCREQEAVLKYMVAFREPARAAEWCLLVQEVLQCVPWPADVVEAFNSGAFHPSRSTAGATRASGCGGMQRPSLKMGLAEGVPDSITPDHMGHADYFGTSVNLAARIMSAAAHSGQVVMSAELAESIFSAWRYEAELGMYTLPEDDQVQRVGDGDNWQQFSLSGATEDQHDRETHPVMTTSIASATPDATAAPATRKPAELQAAGQDTKWASLTATDAKQPGARDSTRVVRVSAHHVGTYAFKGCGALDMVCLTSDAVIGMAAPQAVAPPAGSKGTLIMAAEGPVVGMQDHPVVVPNLLQELQAAWSSATCRIAPPTGSTGI